MMNIQLKNSGNKICQADINEIEALINFELPEAFRGFYLRQNGGVPEPDYFPCTDNYEPVCIADILRMKYPYQTENTIEDIYRQGIKKNFLPGELLPFPTDWGGNFICIDKNGQIYFYATDTWHEDVDPQFNMANNKRLICHSFDDFVDALVNEEDAFD
ncbi:SMI1/KNR4 family protein [Vibrio quintilis]|uniref:SMI1 / KNR4 family protein n=1 Tax=Vibrio quintilis TaxID=1117707 RepID=A0A1M7YQY8_9VIBR|nr:SMI1/KNR4 family protein [Vibrio quintilis]SHO55007.1 SMI1 / KNR4 family protein [Vibrio quintilis]